MSATQARAKEGNPCSYERSLSYERLGTFSTSWNHAKTTDRLSLKGATNSSQSPATDLYRDTPCLVAATEDSPPHLCTYLLGISFLVPSYDDHFHGRKHTTHTLPTIPSCPPPTLRCGCNLIGFDFVYQVPSTGDPTLHCFFTL